MSSKGSKGVKAPSGGRSTWEEIDVAVTFTVRRQESGSRFVKNLPEVEIVRWERAG